MNSLRASISRLVARIEHLERGLNAADRRLNNIMREGKVLKVYPDEGLAEVQFFGSESRSKKIPWFTQSGEIKDFVPPSEEQRVMVFSPTGDPGKGVILPGGYSDDFDQPHDKGAEAMRTVGDSSDLTTGDKRVIKAATIELHGDVEIIGTIKNNGVNIGDDHLHTEVMPGGALSGPPQS